jgi:hypothetical protein
MNFGDQVTLDGKDYVAVYSRISISNHGSQAINLAPAPTKGLVALTDHAKTIPPGQTISHDYVVAADRFGNQYDWPTDEELAGAGSWDTHSAHMKEYWLARLSEIVNISQLPDERLINAYKAGFIYTHIIRDGNDIHVGENGYDSVFDHDSVGILTTLFTLGDFAAKPLLGSSISRSMMMLATRTAGCESLSPQDRGCGLCGAFAESGEHPDQATCRPGGIGRQ